MPTSKTGKSNKGFTLVELAVVLVLAGIFSLMVVPRISLTEKGDLEASAKTIAALSRHLYNEAALTGHRHQLSLEPSAGAFSGKRLLDTGEIVPLEGLGRRRTLKGKVEFLGIEIPGRDTAAVSDLRINYEPMGWVEDAVIHLGVPEGRRLTLRLQPLTGLIEYSEEKREF